MKRKAQRRFGMKQAFQVLDLDSPKIKGADQAEVNRKLRVWKNTILKSAYRTKVKEVHPDQNAEDPEATTRFKDVRAAFEQIRDDLKINLQPPEPSPSEPSTATECPSCGEDRIPRMANYCHDCGADYNMEPLERRLRSQGLTDRNLRQIKADGTYDRLKKLSPLGQELRDEIALLVQRQRVGLYGTYSGWDGFVG